MGKEKIKGWLKTIFVFLVGSFVALGTIIASQLSFQIQVYIGISILISILTIPIIYFVYSKYKEPDFIKKIKRKRRIKKDIKRLKKGKNAVNITIGDMDYVRSNKENLKNIKGLDVLLKYIDDYDKKIAEGMKVLY